MSKKSKSIDQAQKVLGEPIFIEFSEYVRKIRTSLLVVSSIAIFIVFYEIKISHKSSLLGLKFENFNNDVVMQGLLVINFYLFIHFLFCSIDSFKEWMVRVTGTKVVHQTAAIYADKDGDYPSDPRQSTLYNWWKSEAHKMGDLKINLDSIKEILIEVETEIQTKSGKNIHQTNLTNVTKPIVKIQNTLETLVNKLEVINNTLTSSRIPASLERFDNCFKSLLKTQNLRWVIIELSFPLLLGMGSIISLVFR